MKIDNNADLKKLTTFKMGGTASKLYTPETEDELINLIQDEHPQYFIGGGSNIIINTREFDSVVNLREFNSTIENKGNGIYIVGASVRLQKLIKTINADGYGGIEYLYSVPGLVGGAVVMNAGRGKSFNKCISDYIESVKVFFRGQVYWMVKADCKFSYRMSNFQHSDAIVLAVRFKFSKTSLETSEALRKERLELCKKRQDNSAPNFGTVFCESNKAIMQLYKYLPIGKKNGIEFSGKTANWMLNNGGSFDEAIKLLGAVEKTHKLFGQKCRAEVVIWQ